MCVSFSRLFYLSIIWYPVLNGGRCCEYAVTGLTYRNRFSDHNICRASPTLRANPPKTKTKKVNYKNNMPDIEVLMEAWPPEVEEIIDNVNGLSPEIDLPLEDYARMVSERGIMPAHHGVGSLDARTCQASVRPQGKTRAPASVTRECKQATL